MAAEGKSEEEKSSDGKGLARRGEAKELADWIAEATGLKLPKLPQTFKNFDKAVAALLDIPTAMAEGKALSIRGKAARREQMENAVAKALENRVGEAAPDQVARVLDGMAQDYLERREGRKHVLELAAEEIKLSPPSEEAKRPISDDWMAFFKGKVDQLGNEEARFLFAKVLAGEVKHPGSFSKRALAVLAELDEATAKVFEALCNTSARLGDDRRTVTVKIGPAFEFHGQLDAYGINFEELNELSAAGLIHSNDSVGITLADEVTAKEVLQGVLVDVAGAGYLLKAEVGMSNEEVERALGPIPVILFTRIGHELRSIVSLEPHRDYVRDLTDWFGRKGLTLTPS